MQQEAETPIPRTAGRAVGVKQDRKAETEMYFSTFTHPVPEYKGTCCK